MTLPLTPQAFWGVVWIGGFFLAILLIFGILAPRGAHHVAPLEALQKRFGLDAVNPGLFLILGLIWICLFGLLAFGLLKLIWDIIWSALPVTDPALLADDPDKRAELWDWRFGLAKLTALTGVLAAVVALPFTLIRLGLMRSQTEQAADSLFNEKIEAALTSLYATRQITKKVKDAKGIEAMRDVHEDDIVRRNAAIDALEGLAGERPAEVIRISRILSVYVRELSKELPIEEVPVEKTPSELRKWLFDIERTRSDVESAAKSLGRLHHKFKASFKEENIDLSGSNLRKADLSGKDLNFEQVNFNEAQLQRANLAGAKLQRASLKNTQMQGVRLEGAQLQEANLDGSKLQEAELMRSELQRASLFDSELTGADATFAKLQWADLTLAKLQCAELKEAEFFNARLDFVRLDGADLRSAGIDQSTYLKPFGLRGATVSKIDFSKLPKFEINPTEIFGDSTVTFPESVDVPLLFHHSYESDYDFEEAWHTFQKEIGFDPDDPETWDKRKD